MNRVPAHRVSGPWVSAGGSHTAVTCGDWAGHFCGPQLPRLLDGWGEDEGYLRRLGL